MEGAAGRRGPAYGRVRPAVAALAVACALASCAGWPGSGAPEAATTVPAEVRPSGASPTPDGERTTGASPAPAEPGGPPAPSPAEPGTSGTPGQSPAPSSPSPTAPPPGPTSAPTPGPTPAPAPTTPPSPPATRPPTPPPSASTVPASWRGQDVEVLPTSEPVVALTFDGGASGTAVAKILDVLARHDAPATFFVTGTFARSYPSAVRQIAAAGHPVGNHSDNHVAFPDLTNESIRDQLERAEESITALTGRPAKPLFRFPYGSRTPLDIRVVNDAGYVPFRWTVDTLGWQGTSGGRSVASVRERVLSTARPGQIVLMHVGAHPTDGSTLDADALPSVIEGLRTRGYRFVSLDRYF
ncbi:polysaccharide deacetylase family protein [Georgenia sp. EYE_87]|uniref:polysaccharide deacetylase family protein n=1 Tax=Georgenia sp. EYE_87 TaxID=2853448 RepID=UPI0020054541|nr:polysaccharide deacetylase family protein [Georgenia sp. EYE_87]MCK6212076.1 polysaccharide deacetylase family protein [Georgenia sp. EYE_87]